jgi:hypothetical protein
VLQKLLDWPFKSFEKSLNQVALPHVIIALNATEISAGTDDSQWDEHTATRIFMEDFNKVLDRGNEFNKYIQFWKDRGKKIQSLEDLLKCFYASITVIRIPAKPAYMRIKSQVLRLYTIIERCCYTAYKTRVQVRMLSDADDLHTYLQYAFDHFSIDLDKPFNFIEASLKNNPIPGTFAGNILKLAIQIMDRTRLTDGTKIFSILGQIVASCILLDITRHRSKG